jgi:hypothetical protein
MRIGRVIAMASGAALAGYGIMQLRRSRAANRKMAESSGSGRGNEAPMVTPVSPDADEPKLASVRE